MRFINSKKKKNLTKFHCTLLTSAEFFAIETKQRKVFHFKRLHAKIIIKKLGSEMTGYTQNKPAISEQY